MRASLAELIILFICSNGLVGTASAQRSEQALIDLIRQDCGSCHGMTLKGGLGSPLLPDNLQSKTDEYLFAVIQNGIPGKAMPPWKEILDHHETNQIVSILRNGLAKNTHETP